jgi:hypothetical protein
MGRVQVGNVLGGGSSVGGRMAAIVWVWVMTVQGV